MKHIKDIKFIGGRWEITLHSGAIIQCGLNLVEALRTVELYTSPQPMLSNTTVKQILDPELEAA